MVPRFCVELDCNQVRMETVIARLKEQASQIQQVSAQLEVNKTAPQIVLSNP
jgi:hypothetical protein